MANGIKTKCDFCNAAAIVDGKTRMGPWAYMCQMHFDKYGCKTTGLYTRLAAEEETKECSCCHKRLPLSDFYRYTDAHGTVRYRCECKECNLSKRAIIRKGN